MRPALCAREIANGNTALNDAVSSGFNEARALCAGNLAGGWRWLPGIPKCFNEARALCAGNRFRPLLR